MLVGQRAARQPYGCVPPKEVEHANRPRARLLGPCLGRVVGDSDVEDPGDTELVGDHAVEGRETGGRQRCLDGALRNVRYQRNRIGANARLVTLEMFGAS